MSGGKFGTAFTGAVLMYGGGSFARAGWKALRRPALPPQPGRELAAPAPGTSPAWKLLWLAMLLFGAFVFVCGLFLALSIFLAE
jgi:hypothetical protein